MSKPIGIGQIWLLEQMVERGGISNQISTSGCPEAIGMAALRGLEKRGFCTEVNTAIFRITDEGRHRYVIDKPRLDEAKRQRRQRELEQIEEEDRLWREANPE